MDTEYIAELRRIMTLTDNTRAIEAMRELIKREEILIMLRQIGQ